MVLKDHTTTRYRSGIVLAMTAVMVLAGAVSFAAVAPVSAAPTQINSCTVIDQPGRYELAQDITNSSADECIKIEASNVVFDGNGHTIEGDGAGTGVYVENIGVVLSNVTVTNVTVTGWHDGISYEHVNEGTITKSTVTDNLANGIDVSNSGYITLTHNEVTSNGMDGIVIDNSNNNTLTRNEVTGNDRQGIYLDLANNNTLTYNTIKGNGWSGIVLDDSNNNMLRHNKVIGNDPGIRLADSNSNIVTYNNVTGNSNGIGLDDARNNTLAHNTITANTLNGITLYGGVEDNLIYDNYLENDDNVEFGILFNDGENTWNVSKRSETNIIGGPTTGGNYYAKPGGAKGYSEQCADANGDGFCDQPYELGAPNNIDYLPLTTTVSQPAQPEIIVTPASLDFGTVPVGDSATKTIKITNEGNATLSVSSISISGPDASAFSVSDSGSFNLGPGDSRTVEVRFVPTSVGDKSATLSVQSNDPDEATVSVALSGTGIQQPEPPTQKTLRIEGAGEYTPYSFSTSGSVMLAEEDPEDEVDGSTAYSAVGPDSDTYTFEGDLTALYVGGNATVYVNGATVDPSTIGSDVRSVTFTGTGSYASYEFTVSGAIKDGIYLDQEDSFSGGQGAGAVRAGTETYFFTGDLSDLSVGGNATVYVDGQKVDPSSGSDVHSITFKGTGSYASYEFTVSGTVQNGRYLDPEDSFSGSHGQGAVRAGPETYFFTGTLENLDINGNVTVIRDGEEVTQN